MANTIFFFLTLLPCITTGLIFWKSQNFFVNFDLHFLNSLTPDGSDNDTIAEYFDNIPNNNPLLLESVFYNETGLTKKNKFWTQEGSPSTGRLRKISHFTGLISLISFKSGVSIKEQPSSKMTMTFIVCFSH